MAAPAYDLRAQRAKLRDMPDVGRVRSRVVRGRTLYRIDFSPDLKGNERFLYSVMGDGFANRAEAERTRVRICNEYSKTEDLRAAVNLWRRADAEQNLVMTHAERWLRELERTAAPGTLRTYRKALAWGFRYWEGRSIQEVTTANVREWTTQLHEQGLAPKTIKSALTPLRLIFRRYREDRPEAHDIVWPQVKVPRRTQERMPLGDILDVLDALPDEVAGIFRCCFYTACRPVEARALLIEDYDFRTGKLHIHRALKTGLGGVYALPGELRGWIQKWRGEAILRPLDPLFPCPRTREAWSYGSLWERWRRACGAAGVGHVSIYRALKHSPVTALLEAGASMEDVQALCRHTRPTMTEVYDLSDDERRARGTEMLAELARHTRDTQGKVVNWPSPSPEGHEKGKS